MVVFKDGKDGKAYFIDAIVFDGNFRGKIYRQWMLATNGTIGSTQQIKSFPFPAKDILCDVIDHRWKDKEETTPDINGDWWTHSIKDEKQLDEVFEYYDKLKS